MASSSKSRVFGARPGDHKRFIKDFVAACPLMPMQPCRGMLACSHADLGNHG
jgi:hypothetical protein